MTPLVYLHGFASGPSSTKARYFSEHLGRAGMEVAVPDLAAGDFEHLTISGQLAIVERLAAGRPVDVLGSSLGGYLAALYAARHPEASRLVLLAPAFAFARRWTERLGAAAMDEWRRAGSIDLYHYGAGRDCPLGFGLWEDATRYEDFPDFVQPALIFHGVHDDVVPPAGSAEFVARHPNARLEMVDSGHDLLNVLDEILPRVTAFLTSHER